MIAAVSPPIGNPAAVFAHQLDTVGTEITLRRQYGGAWEEVSDPLVAIPDFTTGGVLRAQSAGMSAGIVSESSGVALYASPTADMRVNDTFQYSGMLYRVVWVGPSGSALDGSGTVMRVAYATAQKAPGAS